MGAQNRFGLVEASTCRPSHDRAARMSRVGRRSRGRLPRYWHWEVIRLGDRELSRGPKRGNMRQRARATANCALVRHASDAHHIVMVPIVRRSGTSNRAARSLAPGRRTGMNRLGAADLVKGTSSPGLLFSPDQPKTWRINVGDVRAAPLAPGVSSRFDSRARTPQFAERRGCVQRPGAVKRREHGQDMSQGFRLSSVRASASASRPILDAAIALAAPHRTRACATRSFRGDILEPIDVRVSTSGRAA